MINRTGRFTLSFGETPSIIGRGSAAGKTESEGPLGKNFDKIFPDPYAGRESFEQAESRLQQDALLSALARSKLTTSEIDFIFAGDLLNQCISSSFGLMDFEIPYLGQYGACSTMAQGLIMSAMSIESGGARNAACVTSSHFCSAERQYRMPLEYGGQRTPTAQRTVTAAGACILGKASSAPKIRYATVGRILDAGITDTANMGAAMAPAAADTIVRFLKDTGASAGDFDGIFTGDLGYVGTKCLYELAKREGVKLEGFHNDCGLMIFDRESQDVHAGGSGCGCCASVLCSTLLPALERRELRNILFVATGALMSPVSSEQGMSIPAIAHLVNIVSE